MSDTKTTTWRKLLKNAFSQTGDNFDKMETTLTETQLDKEFDPDFGSPEGDSFTAWGTLFVYFPVTYDGAEWVGYAPRNPCFYKTEHQGG